MTRIFKPMLAASAIPAMSDLFFPLLASYKYDGIRTGMTTGVAMSRSMLPLANTSIQLWASHWAHLLHGMDGEMIFGAPNDATTFNRSTSGCNKAAGGDGFTFYVFEQWDSPLTAAGRAVEVEWWYDHIPELLRSKVVVVKQRLINTPKELLEFYQEALALGYEGLILKDPDLKYKFGRSTLDEGYCLKWKEFIHHECRILEVQQGKKNTNEKKSDELGFAKRSSAKAGQVLVDQVGGFLVEDVDPKSPHYKKKFYCGPGVLTKEQLKDAWVVRDTLPGKLFVYKSQRPAAGNTDLPRFPGFHGWVSLSDTGL